MMWVSKSLERNILRVPLAVECSRKKMIDRWTERQLWSLVNGGIGVVGLWVSATSLSTLLYVWKKCP